MPVKKLRVSFDIDMEVLVKALALAHSEMNIQVFGTEDRVTHTDVPQIADRGGIKKLVLKALSDKGKMQLHEIRVLIVAAGYSPKSLNSQIHGMQMDRLIRRAGYGIFAITAKGRNHASS